VDVGLAPPQPQQTREAEKSEESKPRIAVIIVVGVADVDLAGIVRLSHGLNGCRHQSRCEDEGACAHDLDPSVKSAVEITALRPKPTRPSLVPSAASAFHRIDIKRPGTVCPRIS
jgi:hypothetical protein